MKKLLALCLALMMLALPAAGMAITPDEFKAAHAGETKITEITFDIPNSSPLGTNRDVAILLNGLSLSGIVRDDTMIGAATFKGTLIGTIGLTIQDGVSYLFSNLTDGRPISLDKADLERLLTYLGKLTGQDFSQFTGALNGGLPSVSAAAASIDPTAFAGILQDLQQNITVESVSEGGDLHDLATQKITLTVTSSQLAEIIATFLSQPSIAAAIQQGGNDPQAAIASVRQSLPQTYGDANIVIYLDDAQAPVYGTLSMKAKVTTAPDINGVYFRKTENGNATYGAQLRAYNDTGDLKLSVAVPSATAENTNIEARLHVESQGQVVMDGTASFTSVVNETADIYTRETLFDGQLTQDGQTKAVQLTVSDKLDANATGAPLTTDVGLRIGSANLANIHVATAFSTQPVTVNVSNAVHAASMTDDELQTWLQTLVTTVQTKLRESTGTLPAGLFQ